MSLDAEQLVELANSRPGEWVHVTTEEGSTSASPSRALLLSILTATAPTTAELAAECRTLADALKRYADESEGLTC